MNEKIAFEKTSTFLLGRVTTAYRKRLEDSMAKIEGLHGGQVFVLIELWKEDGLRQVDIAERLSLKPPTVNKMIKGLIDGAFVNCHKLSGDKRSSRIFLTRRGHDVRVEVEAQWVELEADYLSGLTETERLILPDLLGKLRSAYAGTKNADDD